MRSSNGGGIMGNVRFVVLIAFAVILVGISLYPKTGPDGASAGGTDVAAGGFSDKITGTATGTSHHSFPDYLQASDAVTKANIVWEEDPGFLFGCNCRVFFPTGGIDWTAHYATDDCSDTATGHVEAGQGLPLKTAQMLIL
jgi:hypothetical protein